jgi:hypothetical protein
MEKMIKIDNDYIFINSNNEKMIDTLAIDVKEIRWSKIKANKNLLLKIDFDNIKYSEYKAILKKVFRLKKKAKKYKLNFYLNKKWNIK